MATDSCQGILQPPGQGGLGSILLQAGPCLLSGSKAVVKFYWWSPAGDKSH